MPLTDMAYFITTATVGSLTETNVGVAVILTLGHGMV